MPKNEFVRYVVSDLFVGLDGVEAREMFGEHALYLNGTIFGLVAGEAVHFKVDDTNRAKYQKAGSAQFTCQSGGKSVAMPYWEVPAEVLENRETLAKWAQESAKITQRQNPT